MGWWGITHERVCLGFLVEEGSKRDTGMYMGDGPADSMGDATAAIVKDYERTWKRKPYKREMEAALEFVMGGMDLEDPPEQPKVKPKYPESDKLLLAKEQAQAIGEFLEWLQTGKADTSGFDRPVFLAAYCLVTSEWNQVAQERVELVRDEWEVSQDTVQSYTYVIEQLLSRFFGIDQSKLEQERRLMLEEMRKHNLTDKETK